MKKNRIVKCSSFITLAAVMAMSSINAFASNDAGRRPGPPPQAIDACKGKEIGDTVTFAGRNGEQLQAVCKEIQGQVAAVPDGPRPEDRNQ